MHGDLYAHNLLWNGLGDCLLGDFGAASFIPQQGRKQALALQRIEVRAFACLLEELLERCVTTDTNSVEVLRELHDRCAQMEVEARPLFADIRHLIGKCSTL